MAMPVFTDGNFEVVSVSFDRDVIAIGESTHFAVTLKNTSGVVIRDVLLVASAMLPYKEPKRKTGGTYVYSVEGMKSYIEGDDGEPLAVNWAKGANMTFSGRVVAYRNVEGLDTSLYHISALHENGSSPSVPTSKGRYGVILRVQSSSLNGMSSCINLNNQGELDETLHVLGSRDVPILSGSAVRSKDGTANDEGQSVLAQLMLDTKRAAAEVAQHGYTVSASVSPSVVGFKLGDDVTIGNLLDGSLWTPSESLFPTDYVTYFSNAADHTITVRVANAYESTEISFELPKAFANVHMSGAANGGVCFGGFSTSTDDVPKLESYYPAYLYGGIESVAVTKYDALTYASGFEAYPGHEPLVTRVGCFVFLDGMIRATASKATSSDVVMATLPEWARPRVRVNQLMQGSGANVWWMEVYPDGTVCATRYRPTNSTTYASISSGAQLPVSAMWIAADAYPTEVQTASDTVTD